MKRLTVHITQAPKNRVELDEKGSKKTTKKEKIFNTISIRNISNNEDVKKHLNDLRAIHKIASWESGNKKGEEMIYISNEK
tara:strand:- start:233 stop:475 length:243 start_codon:yes stop_codon:yes gene_type:complete